MRLTFIFLLLAFTSFGQQSSEEEKIVSLVGTSWLVASDNGSSTPFTVHFLEDRSLNIQLEGVNRADYFDCEWKARGKKIKFSVNHKFVVYTGTITNNYMIGTAKNKTGMEWKWSAELITE